MKVFIIIKPKLEHLPPVCNLIEALISLGYRPFLICSGISNELQERYKDKIDIEIITLYKGGKIVQFLSWMKFRKGVFDFFKKNDNEIRRSVLWIGSADAILLLGKKLFQYKYIFQCHELYDLYPKYKFLLRRYMQNAIFNIVPEINRASIFRSWYKLKETPLILPNKPFAHPLTRCLEIKNDNALNILDGIKQKKIILYQGVISYERDITSILEASKLLTDEWVVVLMGNTDSKVYLETLKSKYPSLIHIEAISTPYHLDVTSWARIGIMSYSFCDLNHVFCAPNKIWEYAGFGIPMIASDVQGIGTLFKQFNCGVSLNLDSNNYREIADSILHIDQMYEYYSLNAIYFFQSVDYLNLVKCIIKKYVDAR